MRTSDIEKYVQSQGVYKLEINLNFSPNSIPTDCKVGKYYQTNVPPSV
jgi:hypothetical protein